MARDPLFFEPRAVERVWGGRRLESWGRRLPPGPVGETWEISAVPECPSTLRGREPSSFLALLETEGASILGDARLPPGARFPLLVKLLDAALPLSVQLHPRDAEARAIEGAREGSVGKSEAWVILEAEEGAEIVHGLAPGVDPLELYARLERLEGRALTPEEEREYFRWVPVEAGDCVYLPAGSVHALGPGIVLLEVQQSSDLTYRIYDWGRPGRDGAYRQLHLDKARRVAIEAPSARGPGRIDLIPRGTTRRHLLEADSFALDVLGLEAGAIFADSTCEGRRLFHILFAWNEPFELRWTGGEVTVPARDFVLLPADLGAYELRGRSNTAGILRALAR